MCVRVCVYVTSSLPHFLLSLHSEKNSFLIFITCSLISTNICSTSLIYQRKKHQNKGYPVKTNFRYFTSNIFRVHKFHTDYVVFSTQKEQENCAPNRYTLAEEYYYYYFYINMWKSSERVGSFFVCSHIVEMSVPCSVFFVHCCRHGQTYVWLSVFRYPQLLRGLMHTHAGTFSLYTFVKDIKFELTLDQIHIKQILILLRYLVIKNYPLVHWPNTKKGNKMVKIDSNKKIFNQTKWISSPFFTKNGGKNGKNGMRNANTLHSFKYYF